MLCLGIESTAHTFGVGIVNERGEVLANSRSVYKPKAGWGIVPKDTATHHKAVWESVLAEALEKSGIEKPEIDLVSWSQGPGLPPCLHVGLGVASQLSKELKKPLVGVNHCIAHIEIGRLKTKSKDPVVLYVSGGNTQIISFVEKRYRIFGETQDVGVGNALDKFGREAGFQFPCGPEIQRLAKGGKYIELPYVVKGMDLSFSGIVTEALKKLKAGERMEDVCFSLQETMFSMLTEVVERALAHTGKSEVLLTGGVAANTRLQEMLSIMCDERGAKYFVVPNEYAGDCGANIAWLGILAHQSGIKTKPEILPRQRTDDIEVKWI